MNLKPVIGLEIHVQLKTNTKMFCGCDNSGEDKPINSCICEICLGHPGTLPLPNETAIQWSLKASLALNCDIPTVSKFDRKHYFYPDLPKGYQISQYDEPLGKGGFLEINGQTIRINRLHLEEDAAKLLHRDGYTLVDFNRAGTPLMEIVTEPDIEDPRIAGNFLRELRAILKAIGVSDADMEKGHLRCDANISLRKEAQDKLYPKTEIKNINSFKAVERALAYEIKRQTLLWEQAIAPKIESTRGWDEEKGATIEQREKEAVHDYRYFCEPDIPPIRIMNYELGIKNNEQSYIDLKTINASLPELPQAKRQRFMNQYNFSLADASILTRDYALANYTEAVMSELYAWIESLEQNQEQDTKRAAKLAENWLINNLLPLADNFETLKISPENFAELIAFIAQRKINSTAAQSILKIMAQSGKDPNAILLEENLTQMEDDKDLKTIIAKVIAQNKQASDDLKKGKEQAIKTLIGGVMRETKGRANPQLVEKLIKGRQ